jgi:hypothetical protein
MQKIVEERTEKKQEKLGSANLRLRWEGLVPGPPLLETIWGEDSWQREEKFQLAPLYQFYQHAKGKDACATHHVGSSRFNF